MTGDAGRARLPDTEGMAVRDGVRLAWASYGDGLLQGGRPTVMLMPTWSLVHSRIWKAQVGYLARHFRVITFDGRGNGASDRPVGAAAYADSEFAADTVAVLDAAGVDRAVLVSYSCSATWSVHVAAEHPERVLGLMPISPACGFPIANSARDAFSWHDRLPTTEGWAKYNRHNWLEGDYPDFLRFFFGELFSEPHSTKQIEDGIGWGLEISPATLVDTNAGRLGTDGAVCTPLEPLCAQVRCPVRVIHGSDDHIRSLGIGERLAKLTGGSLLVVDGAGHGLPARSPVLINHEIRRFAERFASEPEPERRHKGELASPTMHRPGPGSAGRPRRVLYISSPIGLGHARRDLAIADELRVAHPGLQIDWLAQHPVTRVLADRGERIHPASAGLASETARIEDQADEHDLHAFQAIRRMDEILVNNFMVFSDLVEREPYDLVVGDEAWDVDYFLHENPELKRCPYAWLTDFVGWLPMPDGGAAEAALTADYNAEMLEHRARHRRLRDRSVFVGNPDDIVDAAFGPGLPAIADWTRDHFDFAGYVTGFDPAMTDRDELRERLGWRPGERWCVVTVGGSGVGAALLRRVLDAAPRARRLAADLRFLVVCGPRIDPRRLPSAPGVRVVGYLPNLYEYLAACDVALVQGGLTTCMELTAAGRPFVYVPLQHHFEQNFHVRRRLERYGAGRCLPYADACDPERLAATLVAELGTVPHYRPVESDGARRAAALLADLL